MKNIIAFIISLLFFSVTVAQHQIQKPLDSLLTLLDSNKKDTDQVKILSQLAFSYIFLNPDSGFLFAKRELELSQILNDKYWEMDSKTNLGIYWWSVGDFPTSIKLLLETLEYYKSVNDTLQEAFIDAALASVFRDQLDYETALRYSLRTKSDCQTCDYSPITSSIYNAMKKYDSALLYLQNVKESSGGWEILTLARTLDNLNRDSLAFYYYRISIARLMEENNLKDLAGANYGLALLFKKRGIPDSALSFAKQALDIAQKRKFSREILQSYLLVSDLYSGQDSKKAFLYLSLAMATKDSIYNQERQRQISSYKFNEELNQQEIKDANEKYRIRLNVYLLSAGFLILLVVAIGLWRRNVYKQRSYALLQKQKQEIDFQKTKAETTLEELKTTQAQLIQSEKMASLGELTAGIAHEIQNPLNFVNNFSEVNSELIADMKDELKKGNVEEAKRISDDIDENEQKIILHGKRADAIVKGMLQHSRTSSGQKEPTDINALCDEYLRLAYHGLRAKDKSFNAKFETDFDPSIGRIDIVPQEIGRVILNLINNAFYAVGEREKLRAASYEPLVVVSTKRMGDKIEIRVKDNGNGIPKNVVDKIFQPFFTTKPTGQGTGLGLSLSYDIIKAHGGEIKVETKGNEGTKFTIQFPL